MNCFRSQGYETILLPQSTCPYTSKEQAKVLNNGVKLFTDGSGSHRFVMYINGRAVSALQIMAKDGFVEVANVITVKAHRRKGYAKTVWIEAKKIFPVIRHSYDLSPDGKIFAEHCN